MSYVIRCKLCFGDLKLFSFKFVDGPPIEPDGFDLYNTKDGSTTDEEVICADCRTIRPLELKIEGSFDTTMHGYWVIHKYKAGYAEVLPHKNAEFRIEGFISERKDIGPNKYDITITGDSKYHWRKRGYSEMYFDDMDEAIQWTKAAISRMTADRGGTVQMKEEVARA